MRVWCLHVDGCQFSAEQPRADIDPAALPTDTAEAPDSDETAAVSEASIDDGVVALVALTRQDTTSTATSRDLAAAAHEVITDAATDLGESAIAVIPAPALTDTPARNRLPTKALQMLDAAFDQYEGTYRRAPVGWHLAVDISARGHPYASRVEEATGARQETEGVRAVLTPSGEMVDPEDADLPTATQRYLDRRRAGETAAGELDRGPARDAGLLAADERTLTPAGTLVRDLLSDHLETRLRAAGARPVSALGRPSASANPVQASVLDRVAAQGQSATLFVLDAANPELWTVAPDHDAALDAVETQATLLRRWLADAGFEFTPVMTVPGDSSMPQERLDSIATTVGRPTILERTDGKPPVVELAVTDETGLPLATVAVQMDSEPEAAGDERVVVRARVDSLDSFAVATCRPGATDRRSLPVWLAPTQVRLLPLDSAHLARCEELADELDASGVRVDIDDRQMAVGERIAAVKAAGIPYFVVVGDDEEDSETMPVTDRGAQTERDWPPARLAAAVADANEWFPVASPNSVRRLGDRLFPAGEE